MHRPHRSITRLRPEPPPEPVLSRLYQSDAKTNHTCCNICCFVLLFFLLLVIVLLVIMASNCSSVSLAREHIIEDVRAGFVFFTGRGTFRSELCDDECTEPKLLIIERNNRDHFPSKTKFGKNEDGVFEFIAPFAFRSWFEDCYAVDIILFLPDNGNITVIDLVDINIILGFAHHSFPHTYPITLNHPLHIKQCNITMAKETMYAQHLILDHAILHTTVKVKLYVEDSNETSRSVTVTTNFGEQDLTVYFAPEAKGVTFKHYSHTGKVQIDMYGNYGGVLHVSRSRKGDFRPFGLDSETIMSPHSGEFGNVSADHHFLIDASSRVEPGHVVIRFME
ncbi:hypothetical protein RCL1_002298 [Eukaryota sp. TZLM3-RCL]